MRDGNTVSVGNLLRNCVTYRSKDWRSAPDGAPLNPFLGFAPRGEIQAGTKKPVVGGEFCPFVAAGPNLLNRPFQELAVSALCTESPHPGIGRLQPQTSGSGRCL